MRNRITYLLACLIVSGSSLAQSVYKDNSYSPAERAENLVKQLTLEEKVSLMMDNSKPVERLGIKPYNWWNEALHGVARSGLATVFPQPIGIFLSRSFTYSFRCRIRRSTRQECRLLERGQLQTLSRADHLDTHGEHLPRPSLGTGYRNIR